ncbi:DUF2141 domain-containing protein [Putridiphycobacter roseus]|uniref:DUF2141 domain-containing protein n=1 Tax=Putridiphycobacter roseus TaxID=2219161 RepID=A0A2W1N382_9FLAO|nr:DUF2141 domain-containing protein [Putridiphycobacter roseus]PZE18777.1 DUF2141 domain-containing protein [Putridiphycobacter roseus]
MKRSIIILCLSTIFLGSSFKSAENHLVKVYLKNIVAEKGTAYVNIYTSEGFPKSDKQLQRKSVKITGNTAYVTFSVPNGNYAIAMYHDVNDNDQMDKNWIGYPLEPYGFSRNFKPTISEPDFTDCNFTVKNASKTLTINLIQ